MYVYICICVYIKPLTELGAVIDAETSLDNMLRDLIGGWLVALQV